MAETILTITRGKSSRRVPLDPKGLVLGRSVECDITLDSPRVSRRHARIFRDPFDRWLIQDLGSRNGVKVDGQKADVHAMQPGREVVIGPFVLALSGEARQIPQDPALTHTTTTLVSDSAGTDLSEPGGGGREHLSRARLKRLNAIADRLAGLRRPATLYPELCRCVARAPGAAALVLRLGGEEQLPQILSCHISGAGGGAAASAGSSVPLSRRVVQAVRSGRRGVVATSRARGEDIGLTIVDEAKPRTVFCGPIGETAETVDVLYVDVPADQAMPDMYDFLQAVTRQAGFARKSLLLAEAQAEQQLLEQQLSLARAIQSRLTPTEFGDIAGVDVAVHYQPAMWVGGDYCDVWLLDDGRLAFTVADVAGKGLPAAMAMANLEAALRSTMAFSTDLSEVVGKMNELVVHNLPERMFVTLFLGLLRPADGQLQYVNAGHIRPLVMAPEGGVWPLGEPTGPPLGVTGGGYDTAAHTLGAKAGLVLVTDGITESTSPKGELFGTERLTTTLTSQGPATAQELVASVVAAAAEFRASRAQQDDVTVLGLVVGGQGGA